MAVSGMAVGAASLLVGQSTPVAADTTSWLNVMGGLTSLTFAVWYAWYVTTKTIPERDKTHAETINHLVQEFRTETKEQRQVHVESVGKIESSMDRLSSVIERNIERNVSR